MFFERFLAASQRERDTTGYGSPQIARRALAALPCARPGWQENSRGVLHLKSWAAGKARGAARPAVHSAPAHRNRARSAEVSVQPAVQAVVQPVV